MATRTKSEVLAHLTHNAPRFLSGDPIGLLLLEALALLFSASETLIESLRALLFRQTSSGEWLDEIGREIGVDRRPGEGDDDYAARLILSARGVTPDALRAEIADLVARLYGEGYQIRFYEPRVRGIYSGHSAFSDFSGTITLPDRPGEPAAADLIWLAFPKLERRAMISASKFAFSDFSFSDRAAAVDQIEAGFSRYLEREVMLTLRRWRAAGVAVGATIEDLPQVAWFALLFDTPSGSGPFIGG